MTTCVFYATFFVIEFICMVIFYFIMDKLTQYEFFDKDFGFVLLIPLGFFVLGYIPIYIMVWLTT